MSAETRTIDYYQDFDTDDYIAKVNGLWLFRLRVPITPESRWEFQIPGSPAETFLENKLSPFGKATHLAPGALTAGLPSVPEVPKGPFPPRESYAMPRTPQTARDYPSLVARLAGAPDTCEHVQVVLREDRYESLYGDGTFHDFYTACFDRATAENVIATANPSEWYRYYIVPLTIALFEDAITFPGFELGPFHSYSLVSVLQALEARLTHPTCGDG